MAQVCGGPSKIILTVRQVCGSTAAECRPRWKGRSGGACDQDAPVGDALPRQPRQRPASKLPRIDPTARQRAGLATRIVAGLPGPQGGACGPVASGASRSQTRAAPVLRLVHREPPRPRPRMRGGRRGEGRRHRGPRQNNRGQPGIERRRRHRDVVGEQVMAVVVQKKRGIANGQSC
ncbi:hypothetical protein MRX96_040579 [Rhipicephalus microplus]